MTKPIQSGRPACGSLLSSTLVSVTASASTQIGMFTQKIQCQDRPLVSTPPSTGPTATATPVVAPKYANAVPRSRPVNAPDSRASAVANMIAPPTPCAARASDRNSTVGARPQNSDPTVNTSVPIANSRLRP